MIEPMELILAAAIAIGLFAFTIVALLAGGGMAAVRRQRRQLALLALALAAVALVVPLLERQWGDALLVVGLGVSVLLFAIRQRQRRGEPPELAEQRRAAMRSPRGRLLIVAVIVFTVFVTVLAATLGRLSR